MGVVLGRAQNQARANGRSDAISLVAKTVVEPVAAPIGRSANQTVRFFGSIGRSGELEAENARLRKLAQVAATYAETVDALRQEIEDLRKLNDMPAAVGRIKIPGRIIGYFPHENRVTLDVGSSKLVKVGLPVVAADGLVGVVQTVDGGSCQVRLLSSPRPFLIGATVLRDPPATGLLHGEAADRLTLEFTDINAAIEVGDLVITSGHSELIPKGIPIGRVVQVFKDDEFGTRIAQVFPAVALGRVEEVLVLR